MCDWTEASPAGDTICDITFGPDDLNAMPRFVMIKVLEEEAIGISVTPTQAPEIQLLSPLEEVSLFESINLVRRSHFRSRRCSRRSYYFRHLL